MSNIVDFAFNPEYGKTIKDFRYGDSRPVVYLIEGTNELYVGETTNIFNRWRQHYENPERQKLDKIYIVHDEEFNKSATLDIESWLIQYLLADQKYILQNRNLWLQNHNYYDREKYKWKFEWVIWPKLQEIWVAKQKLVELKNTDVFKYSPYKSLSTDQVIVVEDIFKQIKEGTQDTFLINGKPGTWKTVLAIFLFKYLKEQAATKHLKVGLVVPMTWLRGTLKKVFSLIKWLKSSMVIWPSDVDDNYDILIVDETHRLKRRFNLTNYKSFDDMNKKLWFAQDGTELDRIYKLAKTKIFFYDPQQSVKPTDIDINTLLNLSAKKYELSTQMRVEWGEAYMSFIDKLFDGVEPTPLVQENYDFKLFNNFEDFRSNIIARNNEHGLARLVAWYAWEWKSKHNYDNYDIEIEGIKLKWNSTNSNWVNSPRAIEEVWCIHTIQWYDLNYVWVIIWPELSYDKEKWKFKIVSTHYRDINGKRWVQDPAELERYIINIYKVLMTRGIKWTYVYIVDKDLREYISKIVGGA